MIKKKKCQWQIVFLGVALKSHILKSFWNNCLFCSKSQCFEDEDLFRCVLLFCHKYYTLTPCAKYLRSHGDYLKSLFCQSKPLMKRSLIWLKEWLKGMMCEYIVPMPGTLYGVCGLFFSWLGIYLHLCLPINYSHRACLYISKGRVGL